MILLGQPKPTRWDYHARHIRCLSAWRIGYPRPPKGLKSSLHIPPVWAHSPRFRALEQEAEGNTTKFSLACSKYSTIASIRPTSLFASWGWSPCALIISKMRRNASTRLWKMTFFHDFLSELEKPVEWMSLICFRTVDLPLSPAPWRL